VFNCAIFTRRKVAEWIPAADNLRQIKKIGLENWLRGQRERQRLVEELLENYNEGRSMSLYCRACARMPIELINSAITQAKKKLASKQVDEFDLKAKAKILKAIIKDLYPSG
jgi:hypothetical protein